MDPHAGLSLPAAPQWAFWAGQLGAWLIWAAVLAFTGSLIAAFRSTSAWTTRLFIAGSACLFGSFALLIGLFVQDQFQYEYIYARAEISTALKYKIAGVWSGQQGSFLLWACTSALLGLLALKSTGLYRRWFVATYSFFLATLAAILAYETPFKIAPGAIVKGTILMPPNGNGMTPALQNYWVVIHPPTIFLGFGSLTVLACWAVSAMLARNPVDWAKMVRPWASLSAAILGLGVCMGGLWAYETLGWGGFWAWDPVENASFVPWLLTVGLIHGLIVQSVRGRWIGTNLLLGGLPLLAFIYGTFLTRSGFLTDSSVHSFAEMDRVALWILLGLLVASVVGFLGLWTIRGRSLAKAEKAEPLPGIHREKAYGLGVLLLSLLSTAIAIGMSIPFFMSVLGKPSRVVEEGLYHLVVSWFFVPIMLLVGLAPFLAWKSLGINLVGRLTNVLSVSLGIVGVSLGISRYLGLGTPAFDPLAEVQQKAEIAMPFRLVTPLMPWMMVLLFLCVFALVGNLWRISESIRRTKPVSWGGFVSHVGLAVLMAGLVLSRGFEKEQRALIQPGSPAQALGYVIQFRKSTSADMYDRENKVIFDVAGPSGTFEARPTLYYVPGNNAVPEAMTWPHIERRPFHDIYFAMSKPVVDAWDQPVSLVPGATHAANGVEIKNLGLTRAGEPGAVGTKFGVRLQVRTPEGVFDSHPKLILAERGLTPELSEAGPELRVSMQGIDVATKAVTVQPHYWPPIYPMLVFYKPMTILVWIGTGILCLGGLMSAFYRRPRTSGALNDAAASDIDSGTN